MQRNRRSLEYSETFTEFENSQSHRLSAAKFTEKIGKQDKERQKKVLQWLSVYLCDEEHILHRETRKICQDAGRWLLQHKDFKNWLDPESCPFPLLWLTGKPGAVIDEVRSVKDSTVVFFYCKYGDDRRDSLVSILRSLLGQLIPKIPHLLPYFYEKASVSGEGFLSKPSIVKEMLQMALDSLDKTYIIVDGLDECGKQQAKEITSWFQDLMENLCLEDRSSVRCLFVSQDEAKITAPTISVTEHLNKGDLSKVAAVWHRQLENKFGPLRSSTTHIQNILLTRARGMFIFAELMFKYLEDQPNLASLIQELKSERLPVKLTEVYLKEEHVLPNDTNLSLSLLTLNYLAFPQFDLALDDDTLIESIRNGGYAFYDYASVFWAAHLQSSMPLSESKDQVDEFQTTLNSFLGVHWSSPSNPPKVGQRLEHSLDSIQAPELREKVSQAILSHRKQVGTYRKPPASGEVLNIWRVTERSRALFEKIAIQELSEPEGCGLSRFYGSNWFRCPRMDCFFYYHGFQTQEERESHVLKHERPFFCSVAGCLMNFAGCISEDELNAHLFGWHGVDRSDETEYPKAPKQTKQTRTESTRDPNKPFCEQCLQSFAGKSSLKRHIRAKHERETPFACDICGQRFGRKYTLDRHRPIHDEEDHRDKFICEGELEDGSKWGCGRAFLRKTVLSEHFTKRTGRNCIRPYLLQLEKQKLNSELTDGSNRNIFANQSGINAKTLLAIGESLPSFDEFLRICGLGQLSTNDANGDGLISESEPLS
ncbi:hypothetical protein N7488_001773 [Penicillium malachiteum]|nr:hypothetical protein N7488_001773 [Penicillium malachiteum]